MHIIFGFIAGSCFYEAWKDKNITYFIEGLILMVAAFTIAIKG